MAVPPCEPSEEICDNKDNDCDGLVDEGLVQDCTFGCDKGHSVCSKGEWSTCDAKRKPSPEICNGVDDNCDGQVDENIPIAPCYPGNPRDLAYGICHYGTGRCVAGRTLCENYQLPELEVCDGIDNNCDGTVDNGTGNVPVDIVFGVDYSGSMADVILGLQQATSNWATKYGQRQDIRIALVGMPSPDFAQDGKVILMLDLSNPAQFAAALRMYPTASGGSNEPSIDAIFEVCEPSNPLSIHWTPLASRAMVVYTDEPPQSYLTPAVSEQEAWDAAVQSGMRMFVFSPDSFWYRWSPKPFDTQNLGKELDDIILKTTCGM